MTTRARVLLLPLVAAACSAPYATTDEGVRSVPLCNGPDGSPGDGGLADGGVPEAGSDGGLADGGVPEAGSDGSADGGAPPAFLRFEIAVPGLDGPVVARVPRSGALGNVTLESVPSAVRGPVAHASLPVGFEGAFSDAFCSNVRSKAEAAKRGGPGSRAARLYVRESAGAPVQLTFSPVVSPAFDAAVVDGARAAGATQASIQVVNPVVLSDARLEVAFAPDAMSRVLGTDELTAGLEAELAFQLGVALGSGLFTTEILAKDLLCDLAAGKATVVVEAEGSYGSRGYTSLARTQGLVPLEAAP